MATFKVIQVATGVAVDFSNFALTEYQDNVSTKYNEQPVFGRMDPIVTYQGTTRTVSIGVRVQKAARDVMSKLSAMQYPTFAETSNALSISRPPLVRVTLEDLLVDQLCAMKGFAFTPQTGFTAQDSPEVRYGSPSKAVTNAKGQIIGYEPDNFIEFKSVTMKFDLVILHEEPVGFDDNFTYAGSVLQGWLGNPKFGPGKLN